MTAVAQRRDQPEAVVNVVSDRLLFGDAHPYGQPVEGFERTIERDHARRRARVSRDPLAARTTRRWSWRATSTRRRCRAQLEAALGGWTAGAGARAAPPRPGPRARAW